MNWTVTFTNKAAKQAEKLPPRQRDLLALLVRELQMSGPAQPGWGNYSRLGADTHHCHLSHRWVACWRVEDKKLKLIKVYFTGSREDAPY